MTQDVPNQNVRVYESLVSRHLQTLIWNFMNYSYNVQNVF